MIRTTYFARAISHPDLYKNLLVISANIPHYFNKAARHAALLAPEWGLVSDYKNQRCTIDQYIDRYLLLLSTRKLTAKTIVEYIGDDATLICYERVGDFCHRHLIASLINASGISNVAESVTVTDKHPGAWSVHTNYKPQLRTINDFSITQL